MPKLQRPLIWRPVIASALALLLAVFPVIFDTPGARLILVSLLAGGLAALSAWEVWRHASQCLTAQRITVALLMILAGFNFFRGMLGLPLSPIFSENPLVNRWSAEMALLLVVYTPALAFSFLAMANEANEAGYQEAEQALRESEEHYRHTVELNPQVPWTADSEGNILAASTRWTDLTGMAVGQALGTGWLKAIHPDDRWTVTHLWSTATSGGEWFDAEYRVRQKDGDCRWHRARAAVRRREDGSILRWYGTLEDIHDRKLAEERLRWAAYRDPLTGISNRRFFQEQLQQALQATADAGRKVGLLVIDLDDFKQINDRFGHHAGDAVLKELAWMLQTIVPDPDLVARLGGDEFAVIIPGIDSKADVEILAQRIINWTDEPWSIGRLEREYQVSIGGAFTSTNVAEPDELLKQADIALYRSKAAGKGLFRMFEPAMREEMQHVSSALRLAQRIIRNEWIVPHYQPKIELETGAISGFEALLRWHHPRSGVQPPGMIAPAFDDPNLGVAIGDTMLACIIRDIHTWLDAGINMGSIAINASASEFLSGDYAERVLGQLRAAGLPAAALELEVTESVFLGRDAEHVEHALRALSAEGVKIALDDFGTGYASLSHLKKYPVDIIKIDRSFVSNLETEADDAAIVKGVLSLAQSLEIQVVAEGVETPAQACLLWEQGCNVAQGYLFGRPMAAEAVPRFVRSWTGDLSWRAGKPFSAGPRGVPWGTHARNGMS